MRFLSDDGKVFNTQEECKEWEEAKKERELLKEKEAEMKKKRDELKSLSDRYSKILDELNTLHKDLNKYEKDNRHKEKDKKDFFAANSFNKANYDEDECNGNCEDCDKDMIDIEDFFMDFFS